MARADLTVERLREIFHYTPETGVFTWRNNSIRGRGREIKAGDVAGRKTATGYIQLSIMGVQHYANRLAWLYVYGEHPILHVDHINGIRDDNRIVNLRQATVAENLQNLAIRKSNSSGFAGVSWKTREGKWRAQIRSKNKRIHLGFFKTKEEASLAYLAAKKELHYFAPEVRSK